MRVEYKMKFPPLLSSEKLTNSRLWQSAFIHLTSLKKRVGLGQSTYIASKAGMAKVIEALK